MLESETAEKDMLDLGQATLPRSPPLLLPSLSPPLPLPSSPPNNTPPCEQAVGGRVRLLKSNLVGAEATGGHSISSGANGKAPSVLPTRYFCLDFLPTDPSRRAGRGGKREGWERSAGE